MDLDSIDFVRNDRLAHLQRTPATSKQLGDAVRINTQARKQALKMSFLVLAGLAVRLLGGRGSGRRLPDVTRLSAGISRCFLTSAHAIETFF